MTETEILRDQLFSTISTRSNRSASTGALTTGDFDGNGISDFAVADADANTVRILKLANADGPNPSFQTLRDVNVGSMPIAVMSGDLNKDGTDDLVTANSGDSTLSVFLGGQQSATSLPLASTPRILAIRDMNIDGNPDLLVGTENGLSVYLGLGDGTFRTAQTVSQTLNLKVLNVETADINHDGRVDIAVITEDPITNQKTVRTILSRVANPGAQQFTSIPGVSLPTFSSALTVGDFTGDGQADLAAVNENGTDLLILIGSKNTPPTVTDDTYSVDSGSQLVVASAQGVLANDVDQGGELTVILVSAPANATGFQLNDDGSFTYQSSDSYTAADSFTYKVTDGYFVCPGYCDYQYKRCNAPGDRADNHRHIGQQRLVYRRHRDFVVGVGR